MGLSKCAADDRGQKNHRGGQEHSRDYLSPQSNAASSSRPTRLTARIEFGGPQFHYGHRTHYNTYLLPIAAKIEARSVAHRRSQGHEPGEPRRPALPQRPLTRTSSA